MPLNAPEIVYGAPGLPSLSKEDLQERLSVLRKHSVSSLDSAYIYPGCDATLGQSGASKIFSVHTKTPALAPECMTRKSILDGMNKSLQDLQVDCIDLYYLHGPDPTTPIEETLSAIQELYAAKKLKRFGLSNFPPRDVQKVYDIQHAARSVLPTAYQGNYNAVARHSEDDLFPLLRKLGISFYAYSPIAGGFLVKTPQQLKTKDLEGRFSGQTILGDMYNALYVKDSLLDALEEWDRIARDAGISKAALSYRWVTWHSVLKKEHGDGIVVGASNDTQLEETLSAIDDGPLDSAIAERASAIWATVKKDAPRDNWVDYLALKK